MDARRTDVLKASPRMFESDLLDRLSRVHPVVPVLIFLPAITVLAGTAAERMGPLETLAWFEQNRGPADSAAYASALYHASHAQAANANRWKPTGYATTAILGAVIGLALIASARRRPGP